MRIAFDIDGVLADSSHRAGYAPNWNLFYSKIPGDIPIKEGVALVEALNGTHELYFITSRPERVRGSTARWLEANIAMHLNYVLVMRKDGNIKSNTITKLEMCQTIKPDLVFEDDEEAAQVLYDNGFKVMLFLRNKEFTENRKFTEEWARRKENIRGIEK